jgi:energy-coupling factor transport system ATP-binding protein
MGFKSSRRTFALDLSRSDFSAPYYPLFTSHLLLCSHFAFTIGGLAMIRFRNVSLIYPNSEQTIIDNLSFSLAEGEFVLVIGETGIGKSSVLRLMNGLVPHHTGGILSGEIEVAGRSTRLLKPGELSDVVGIVGQNPINGFVCEIVEDEIAFTLETLGISPTVMRKRVEEVLDLLALAELRSREISSLSGGEQQRVAIAAALVAQPKVLLLDEPTSALDPIAAEEVLSILHRLVSDLGLTVVIAEHRLERVIQFVDRILLIKDSGQAELGDAREVLATSPIAPPLVELSRIANLPEVALTIREFRKAISDVRQIEPRSNQKTGEALVSIKNLSASYIDELSEYALSNLSLEIRSGEIVSIMGRNGAGKSTLLKSLVGLSPILSGNVYLSGQDPLKLSGKELIKEVGLVPQDASDLLIESSVARECARVDLDNEAVPGKTLGIYQQLSADERSSIHPRDLSEGQKLILALSIQLSANPKVIALDEPTRGLDYQAKRKLISILKSIAAENRAVLIATHDVELVAELADRVVFLAEGELISQGPTHEALTSSPAFAPQVAKAFPGKGILTLAEARKALEK